jgi:PAS domain S-box-containing protein
VHNDSNSDLFPSILDSENPLRHQKENANSKRDRGHGVGDNRIQELLTGLTAVLRTYETGAEDKRRSKKTSETTSGLKAPDPQVIIYTRSTTGHYGATFMSLNVVSQLGYSPEEFTKNPGFWTQRIHPEDLKRVESGFTALFDQGHFVHEYRFKHCSGEFRWMRDELNLLRDNHGNPSEILGTWVDVTERRRIEKALQESETQYRSLIDNAPIGMVSFDSLGEIIEFNPALLKILGAPELEPTKATDLFTLLPVAEAGISEAISHCLGTGQCSVGELQYKSRNGRDVYTKLYVMPIRGTNGNITGAHAFVQDLSEQKRAEDLIVSSERLKVLGQIATGVGHVFSNLLQVVAGNINMALTNLELRDEDAAKGNLEQIGATAKSVIESVRWLQQFGRERSGRTVSHHELFDLVEVVNEAIEICKLWSVTELARFNLSVTYNLDLVPGCHVEGLRDRIVWMIFNLLKNAVESMPSGGEIKISTSIKGDRVILVIQDSGVGIPADHVKNIVSAFWTSKINHAGMGLTFAAGILRQHGGSMGVKRVRPKGTCFVVRLPFVSDVSARTKALAERAVPRGHRILLVDDDERIISIFEEALDQLDQKVYSAYSGKQALRILEENEIDAVVCDLVMNEMNGWEVSKAIAERCRKTGVPKPVIIMLTGYARQLSEEEKKLHPEVDRVVEKPIDVTKILEIVTEEVEKASVDSAFSGKVDRIDLLEYLQLLLLNGQNVILEVIARDGAKGRIYIEEGGVRHSVCGDLEGEEALFQCLTFTGGNFKGLPWSPPSTITINKPAEFLLIEAARRRDEKRALRA